MTTKKLACPACEATLQVAATLPSGKKIRCPRCSEVFVPRMEEDSPRKTSIQSRKRTAPLADEEDADEQERPARKKTGKAVKKPASPLPWLIGGGVALLIAVGVALAIVFWPSKKDEPVAGSGAPPNGPPGMPAPGTMPGQGFPGPGQGFPGPGQRFPGQGFPGQGPGFPGPGPGFPGPGGEPGKENQPQQPASAGRKVFDMHCARCHQTGPMGRSRGPNLAKVGADPSHTVEWFTAFIRDPQAVKPNARMPKFQGRIKDEELKQLAEYLTTLK